MLVEMNRRRFQDEHLYAYVQTRRGAFSFFFFPFKIPIFNLGLTEKGRIKHKIQMGRPLRLRKPKQVWCVRGREEGESPRACRASGSDGSSVLYCAEELGDGHRWREENVQGRRRLIPLRCLRWLDGTWVSPYYRAGQNGTAVLAHPPPTSLRPLHRPPLPRVGQAWPSKEPSRTKQMPMLGTTSTSIVCSLRTGV